MWRSRWHSLKLFTAGQYNDLPGMRFPGRAGHLPGQGRRRRLPSGLRARFELPVRLDTPVTRLSRATNGGYLAETTTGPIEADQVVVATGPFQVPFTPGDRRRARPELTQLHSADYQGPGRACPRAGFWSSARPTRASRSRSSLPQSRQVDIAVGEKLPTLPQRLARARLWWWLTTLRVAAVPVSSRLGRRLSQRDVVIGGGLRELRRHGVGGPAAGRRQPADTRSASRTASQPTTTASSGRQVSGSTTPGSTSPRSRTSGARFSMSAA